MKIRRTMSVMIITLVVGLFGYLPCSAAAEGTGIEQMIEQAKTPADHEALAAYYVPGVTTS